MVKKLDGKYIGGKKIAGKNCEKRSAGTGIFLGRYIFFGGKKEHTRVWVRPQ